MTDIHMIIVKSCGNSNALCLNKVHGNSVTPINFDLAAVKLFLVLNPILDWALEEYYGCRSE